MAPIVTALGFIGIFAYGIYVCDYILYCEDPSKYVADTPTTKIIGTIDYANGLFILYLSTALFIVGIIYIHSVRFVGLNINVVCGIPRCVYRQCGIYY